MTMQSLPEKVVCFDLDDTLYKEIDFLVSAYKEISACLAQQANVASNEIYEAMMVAYNSSRAPFQEIISSLKLDLPTEKLLSIYRNHKPSIHLSSGVFDVLNVLSKSSCVLGLITDGRSVTQRNKIEALGLYRFLCDGDIVISEDFGFEKPSEKNYMYFMERYPSVKEYIYIGDNTEKDFLAPNLLGWKTVGLLDDGRNIHKQNFNLSKEYMPERWVKSLSLSECFC